nr:MAG TPA: hypothetical protein [Caudoviricetes sp.]
MLSRCRKWEIVRCGMLRTEALVYARSNQEELM